MNLVKDPGRLADLARAIAGRALTPAELLERYLTRIEQVEPDVAAWTGLDIPAARAAALRLPPIPRDEAVPPLLGIPLAIKDVIDVAGVPTRAGCQAWRDRAPAAADAELVAAARTAGALIMGKVHTTELAYFDGPPPTRNPHDLRCTPGGSSSGPAAVVAAGMAPAALGTQTAGSVSRPAAYCGIGGFKPSTGSLSAVGLLPFSPRFDSIGMFGFRIEDAVYLYRALAPAYIGPGQMPPLQTVIVLDDPVLAAAEPAVVDSMRQAVDRLRQHGMTVRTEAAPISFAEITALHKTVIEYELARQHGDLLDGAAALLSDGVRAVLHRGGAIKDADHLAARRGIAALADRFWQALPADAAVLFPATPAPAPQGMATGDPRFIVPFTALGGPIASLPIAMTAEGLPLGAMLIAAPGRDKALADLALQVAPMIELPR